MLVFHDVTEKRRAEEALRRSEERWNAAIENFGEGAIIATEAERVIYWNPAARAMHGFTGETEGIGPLRETPNTFELWTLDGRALSALDEWPMRRSSAAKPCGTWNCGSAGPTRTGRRSWPIPAQWWKRPAAND